MQQSIKASVEASEKQPNNFQSCQAAQAKIDIAKAEFFKDGGEIQQLAGFGVMTTPQKGYGGNVVAQIKTVSVKRKFYINARSCFSRGKEGQPIHVFKLDNEYHFRNCKNRAPEGSQFFQSFKNMVEVKICKLL